MEKIYFSLLTCLLLSFASHAQLPSYIPAAGLVGWWPFTGNAIDSSTNHNDGMVYGPKLTTDRFGKPNCAYSFDGIDDYIDLFSAGLSAAPDTFSASAWFLVNELLADGRDHYKHGVVLTKRHDEYNSWSTIEVNEDSTLVLNVDGPFKALKIRPDFNVINEKWHHVVIIKEDTNYMIVLDNTLIKKGHDAYVHKGLSDNMHVGHHGGWYSYYSGKIDDIGIWNRALSSQEIKNIFESKPPTAVLAEKGHHFRIFPNPAHDFIVLESSVALAGTSYTVTDVTGHIVLAGRLDDKAGITVTALASGTYQLQLDNGMLPIRLTKL